ncbi:MAG: hypothetical protein FWG66_09455 [Spirochaetes bacterium]|nr:hypothetical protein [Spirochaetota bacterium]
MIYTEWEIERTLGAAKSEGVEAGRNHAKKRLAMEDLARKALAKGLPAETASEISGLDIETILNLPRPGL